MVEKEKKKKRQKEVNGHTVTDEPHIHVIGREPCDFAH